LKKLIFLKIIAEESNEEQETKNINEVTEIFKELFRDGTYGSEHRNVQKQINWPYFAYLVQLKY